MSESYQTQLDRVQAAIAAVEDGGQDVTYDGRRITMADLNALYRRETALRRAVERESRGGIGVRFGVPE
ncbi:hypothetical protein [Azospirillum sp. ST 5-10]|uniref:hypothetical protein n=1 Tax=unclassified Azospirillum TaxID=2630922 RepID=UPI003F49BCFA